jgi:hypothetical protein
MAKIIPVLHIPRATLQKDVDKTIYISNFFQVSSLHLQPHDFQLLCSNVQRLTLFSYISFGQCTPIHCE